ncbi:DUF2637 domain-containing protein [Streptomyces sp. 549]|uniref:DUF2637 domain-containing protein n=1 Tax=Streptomyces sp. 549 TaxID=3049076 RepID=UPI0024C23052|nr:DUF2637 domain-containing protein [Streptomyces sp. 549]MDK1475385.1 DUF2637 domain-containing protein [Streptomyces sp. 549]
MKLNRTHRVLIGVVLVGAMVIAAIGFAGSYAAVRELAEDKGFGAFAPFFPIGIDAGIVVLLSLDLLLTWLRIGFPLLRQTAWLLTAATIAFNGAAAWPDPLGVGMHAVIPLLFVVSVEAARHAVGRIADITADKHMEGVRLSRWLLAFPSTFRLWRRMKLWELRSYDEVIRLEQDRLVYQARLQARFGRAWRRKAPVEALMPLKLARFGVPLTQTAPAGLAAAGIEPQLLPPQPAAPMGEAGVVQGVAPHAQALTPTASGEEGRQSATPRNAPAEGGHGPHPRTLAGVSPPEQQTSQDEQPPQAPVAQAPVAQPRAAEPAPAPEPGPEPSRKQASQPQPQPHIQVPNGAGGMRTLGEGVPDVVPSEEELYRVFRYSIVGEGLPTRGAFASDVESTYGVRLEPRELSHYMERFEARFNSELMEDHIA